MSSGGLVEGFNAASKIDQNKLKVLDHNLSMQEDGADRAGRIPINQGPNHQSATKERKKEQERFANLLIRLQETRLLLLQRIETMQEDIDQLLVDRDEIRDIRKALEEFFDQYVETGEFELDEHGRPIDLKVKKAITDWKTRTGQQFDPLSEDAPLIIQSILTQHELREAKLSHTIEQKYDEIKVYSEKLEIVDGLIAKQELGAILKKEDVKNYEEIENEFQQQTKKTSQLMETLDVPIGFKAPSA